MAAGQLLLVECPVQRNGSVVGHPSQGHVIQETVRFRKGAREVHR